MVLALNSPLSNCHLFELTEKLLLAWDQIRNLQETSSSLPALFASSQGRALQVLHLNITRRPGIALLELGDGGAIHIEAVTNTSTFCTEDTVYFMFCLCMDYLQSRMNFI